MQSQSACSTTSREISLEEVALHHIAEDCWTVIHNKVYDISGFHDVHPGGGIILCGAGCDATVLFEHYHLTCREKALKSLQSKNIGILKGSRSPIMGAFYDEVAKRARLELKDLPIRPARAILIFFVDILSLLLLLVFGLHLMQTEHTPPLLQYIVPVALSLLSSRVSAHAHAVGHMQVFGKDWVRFGELLVSLCAARTMPPYALPVPTVPCRKLLHKSRAISQNEYSNKRGPFEHQAIHHVKGADLEHDACKVIASLGGIIRVHDREPLKWFHTLQKYFIFRNISFAFAIFLLDLLAFPLKLSHAKIAAAGGLWVDAVAALIGAILDVLLSLVCWKLPLSNLAVLLAVIVTRMCTTFVLMFFSQHVWSSSIQEELANTDWGKYNTETTISLLGENMQWHPLLWGYSGNTPSTLTYHIEHTLFPGVNYLYLSRLSPIVRATCNDFGITYHTLRNYTDLNKLFVHTCVKFSTSTSPIDKVRNK